MSQTLDIAYCTFMDTFCLWIWWFTSANLCPKTGHIMPTPQLHYNHTTLHYFPNLVWYHKLGLVWCRKYSVVCPVFGRRLAVVGDSIWVCRTSLFEKKMFTFVCKMLLPSLNNKA